MPASTMDPVSATLRNALSNPKTNECSLDAQLAGGTKKALLANIEFESAGSYQSNVLDKLKSKYIVLKSANSSSGTETQTNKPGQNKQQDCMISDDTLPDAKVELFSHENVQLGWTNSDWAVGAGMVNLGNTCYLNSTLQALFHVPAFVNWLTTDKQQRECEESGLHCVICAMRKTFFDSQQRNVNSIRPLLIIGELQSLWRHLVPGRQEDAHEFLRYLVEAMEKSYLNRFKNHSQFDSRTKETTPLNQILGGYLRSAVRCLSCGHVSTTFQHFQDLLLDIRKVQTIEDALGGYFSCEKIDDESYHCEACQKKVSATKQFSLERAPMVLCIQLKRFSISNTKISKNVQFKQRLELSKYTRHRSSSPLVYRLVALVTHMGQNVCYGHYTTIAQTPCGNYYQFDDMSVSPVSHQTVFSTNAYIMLYELERAPTLNGSKKSIQSTTTALSSNGKVSHSEPKNGHKNGTTLANGKTYGPELPPSKPIQNGKTDESGAQRQKSLVITSNGIERKRDATASTSTQASTSFGGHSSKKLVPYDDEDDDDEKMGENENRAQLLESRESKMISTRAANGEWSVTSSSLDNQATASSSKTVNELLKMSHSGYSSNVSNWNGNRSQLSKDIGNEKRDERKRTLNSVDEMDQGSVKHVKTSHVGKAANPGYNPIQEYHNTKNWGQSNNYNRSFYNRQRAHKRFNHKNNYHKGYRYRN